MTVIEKLEYDKNALLSSFSEWVDGPGRVEYCSESHVSVVSRYDSLRSSYLGENYKVFLEWAFDEYHEFENGFLSPDGTIIVNTRLKDCMKVKAFNLFSTGWAYHLNCLKNSNKDFSKPFATCVHSMFRQSIDNRWTSEKEGKLLKSINNTLEEHDPSSKNHFNVYLGLTDDEKKFYFEYDKTLRTAKAAILNKTFMIDTDYIRSIIK